jgi:uncharacterized protein YkwD
MFKCLKKLFKKKEVVIIRYLPEPQILNQYEEELLLLINKHRSELGLNILLTDKGIKQQAQNHTEQLIKDNKASHNGYITRQQQINKLGFKRVNENVAFKYNTVNSIFRNYLKSQGHREVLENKYSTHIGISIIRQGSLFNTLIMAQW